MLVCSVVLRQKRGTIAATVAESATAIDTSSINAVFAILADDNATASDRLDGFVGQLAVEAASAADVVSAASIRNAAVVENTIAGEAAKFPFAYAVMVAETATAASTQGVGAIAVVYGAVLDGTFVDPQPPSTLLGTDVPDSGPITVFEP